MKKKQTRLIIYTGKGGVGKTSISAATGLLASTRGKNTLVISADSANSLGDAFEEKISNNPIEIESNLWVQECDVYLGIEKYWTKTQEWARSVLMWQGIDDIIADELLAFPGMQELTVLLEILEHHKSGKYDLIVVDCAPTGDTFKLLSLPEAGNWWMEKIFPWSKRINRIARPISKFLSEVPLPNDDVFDSAEDIFDKVSEVQKLISDHKLTSLRIVTNPEKMVIDETQRSYSLIGIFGYLCDLIICNRILPQKALEGYFSERSEQQEKNIARIKDSFDPLPIKFSDYFKSEIGKENLRELGMNIFGNEDPSKIFYKDTSFKIQRLKDSKEKFKLEINISQTAEEDFEINRTEENIIFTMSGFRKIFLLPDQLKRKEIEKAVLEDKKLTIIFGEKI